MKPSDPNPHHEQEYNAALTPLMLKSLRYVATVSRRPLDSSADHARRLLEGLLGESISPLTFASEWNSLDRDRQTVLAEIASWSQFLSEQHKEIIIKTCVLLAADNDSISAQERQSIQQIASAVAMSQERVNGLIVEGVRASKSAKPASTTDPMQQHQKTPSSTTENSRQRATSNLEPNKSEKKTISTGWRWVIALGILAAMIGGLYGLDFLYDREQYLLGYQAYREGDCMTALKHVVPVSEPGLVGGFGGTQNSVQPAASTLVAQCETLAKAQSSLAAGDPASSLDFLLQMRALALPELLRDRGIQLEQSIAATIRPQSLATIATCDRLAGTESIEFFGNDNSAAPEFLYSCGEVYREANKQDLALDTYLSLMGQFPDSSVSLQTESALLDFSFACEHTGRLLASQEIVRREEFIGAFFVQCGNWYEETNDFENAIRVYQEFTDQFNEHIALSEIEAGFARSLFQRALSLGAPEIPEPGRSGSTRSSDTVIIIQNDSPEGMRISFSGPEAKIAELDACKDCETFSSSTLADCQDLGPVGTYTLPAGTYNVVVESTSDRDVIPFIGTWELDAGTEYSHCFFIVRTRTP